MRKKKADLYLREDELQGRIEGKYPHPAWTVLRHVRDGTGFMRAGQEADAIAFGTWPSRGFQILGFECKSSRADWLNELKNPQKAEIFFGYCDEWWVVSGEGVVNLEEVPPNWGWYVGTGRGLKLMKPSVPLKSKKMDRIFLMSIVRNISRSFTPTREVEAMAKDRAETLADQKNRDMEWDLEQAEKALKRMRIFEKESGIDLGKAYQFDAATVGKIVKAVLDQNLKYELKTVVRTMEDAKKVLEAIEKISLFKEEKKPCPTNT